MSITLEPVIRPVNTVKLHQNEHIFKTHSGKGGLLLTKSREETSKFAKKKKKKKTDWWFQNVQVQRKNALSQKDDTHYAHLAVQQASISWGSIVASEGKSLCPAQTSSPCWEKTQNDFSGPHAFLQYLLQFLLASMFFFHEFSQKTQTYQGLNCTDFAWGALFLLIIEVNFTATISTSSKSGLFGTIESSATGPSFCTRLILTLNEKNKGKGINSVI